MNTVFFFGGGGIFNEKRNINSFSDPFTDRLSDFSPKERLDYSLTTHQLQNLTLF